MDFKNAGRCRKSPTKLSFLESQKLFHFLGSIDSPYESKDKLVQACSAVVGREVSFNNIYKLCRDAGIRNEKIVKRAERSAGEKRRTVYARIAELESRVQVLERFIAEIQG